MKKHMNKNSDIFQVQWKNKSFTVNIYKNSQDKADSGKVFLKMRKRIKHNIDIVTVPNGPTSLAYIVKPTYYH